MVLDLAISEVVNPNHAFSSVDYVYIRLYTVVQFEYEDSLMRTISFTEFRKNASGLFSEVESGGVLLVLRHGKPIAEIIPAGAGRDNTPSWKRPGLRLTTKGASLSEAIVEERRREDIL